nr:hypothetical protein [Clostridia bacterium]
MMNASNLKGKTRQTSDWRRRMIAFVSALTLLISSCGLTAFAESDEDIYSDPVTAPIPAANTSPEPEEGEAQATPAPEDQPETGTEPQEATGEETETGEEPEVSEEPEDLTVYEPGTLTAEADGVGITVDYTAEARVPEGAVLNLTRAAGGDLYSALKSASKVLKTEENATWKRELGEDAVFYAITLTDSEGNEVHPETGVTLTCTNLEIPADATGFVTGDNAENLDWKDTLTVGFLPDAIGYAYLKQVQIGTVTLTHEDRDYMVTAAYGPDAGFPAGTELKVREILPGTPEYALYSGMTDEALNEDWTEITLERYFDIAFVANGEELEPKADVDVQIVFRDKIEQNEETEVAAVHIENNEANVIEAETDSTKTAVHDDEAIDTVTFTSDSFSVYGVVQKKKITKKVLAADGNTYEINVTYGPEAEIPENAEVRVEEIPEGSDLWEAYRKQTAAALNADDVRMPGLYDITIIDEAGEKVTPQAPVNVAFKLINEENVSQDLQVVHFKEEIPQELVEAESKPEEPATTETEQQPKAQTEEQTETQTRGQTEVQVPVQPEPLAEEDKIASETISASVEGDTITFDTQSFSVYAFAYTVDFHYGEYEYHLQGNGEMLLSELFALLNIDCNVADVISVEFSDPNLLQIEQIEGDWKLTSLAPFLSIETLTVKFLNGDTIVIRVEDAQYDASFMMNDENAGYFASTGSADYFQWSSKLNDYSFVTDVIKDNNQIKAFKHKAGAKVYSFKVETNPSYSFDYWLKIDKDGNRSTVNLSTLTWGDQANPDGSYTDVTMIAFYKPNNQSLIRYEADEHGTISDANHCVKDQQGREHYFSYSGEDMYAHATADWGYILEGWYNGTVLLSTDEYLNLSDVTSDMVITAKFRSRETYEIKYHSTWYYTNIRINDGPISYAKDADGAWVSEYVTDGETAKGAVASSHGNPNNAGEYSYFIAWIDSDGNHVSSNANFVPTGDQIKNTTYTAVFSSSPNYVVIDCDYHCGTVGGTSGLYSGSLDLESANKATNIVFAKYNNNGRLLGDMWPIPNEGYVFDHWEWTPSGGNTVTITDERINSNNSTIQGKGTLKVVFKPHITYDIGVINRVGINSSDSQRWYTNVSVKNATPTADVNVYTEIVNSGDNLDLNHKLSSETRVTQTTTGYNLLTHYMKGWTADRSVTVRLSNGTQTTISQGNLIPPDATILNITEALKLTAVWSSTFPGKTEYNGGNGVAARYNTNSVGFFVRIVDNVADVGKTSLYTDCLYTTRLLLSGSGSFATDNGVSGSRHDYFGNGRTLDMSTIETIDHDLRANSSALSYSGTNYENEQKYDPRYSGASIKIESFPSDQQIFSMIRAWNASRNVITVSGVKVPQWMLNSNYFDIIWYVLKDQENQWHIDGMLIPKYAKLRITKKFIGEADAITAAKEGYTISAQHGSDTPFTRTLAEADHVSADATEYTWILDQLLPLTNYTVQEQNYQALNYAVATSYQLYNTRQTEGLSDNTDTVDVNQVYVYPAYDPEDSYQTVAFTNMYTEPYVMTIMKQDGDTKN